MRSDASLNGLRDQVGSRVSMDEAGRRDAGCGLAVERVNAWDAGVRTQTFPGRLGLEQTLGDAATIVGISDERLRSVAPATRMTLGLSGAVSAWARTTASMPSACASACASSGAGSRRKR